MKLTTKQKEEVFIHSAFYLTDGLNKRFKEFADDYKEKMFGLKFFVDVEYGNFITDILWWREQLQIHLSLAKQDGIDEKSFSIEHVKHYLNRIKDLELMGVIKAMRLTDSYFGYSEAFRQRSNKELCEISKRVMEEILNEEKK